jgi:hypothetical protein
MSQLKTLKFKAIEVLSDKVTLLLLRYFLE